MAWAVANELYSVTTSSNTNLQDLAQAITYSGSEMRRAGYGLRETAASIGAMGNYGIQGSAAGTALANMMRYIQLSAAGQKAKGDDMLKAVGIDAKSLMDSEGHLISLNEIYHKMYEVTKDLDTFSKNQFFYNVFGVRGTREIAAMVQMIEDAAGGASKYEQMMQNMADATSNNALGKAYERWKEDPAGRLAMFRAELDNLRTTVGEQISPLLTQVVGALNKVLGMVGWISQTGLGGVVLRGLAIGTTIQLAVRGVVALVGLLRTSSTVATNLRNSLYGASSGPAAANAQFVLMEAHLRNLILLQTHYLAISSKLPRTGLDTGMGYTIYRGPKGAMVSRVNAKGITRNYTMAQWTALQARAASGAAATTAAINNGSKIAASGFSRLLGFLGGPWGMAIFTLGPMLYDGIKQLVNKQDEEIETMKEQFNPDAMNQHQQELLREVLEEAARNGIIQGMSQAKLPEVNVNMDGGGNSNTFAFMGGDPNNQFSLFS